MQGRVTPSVCGCPGGVLPAGKSWDKHWTATAPLWGEETITRSLSQGHRPLDLSTLAKAFKTSVAHRLLVQLILNPRNERQVSVKGKFYLSMNSPEWEGAQAGYLSPQQPPAVTEGRFSPPLL